MSRSVKLDPPRWYAKESKMNRKSHYKAHRRRVNIALRLGQETPVYRRTSGWLTH